MLSVVIYPPLEHGVFIINEMILIPSVVDLANMQCVLIHLKNNRLFYKKGKEISLFPRLVLKTRNYPGLVAETFVLMEPSNKPF